MQHLSTGIGCRQKETQVQSNHIEVESAQKVLQFAQFFQHFSITRQLLHVILSRTAEDKSRNGRQFRQGDSAIVVKCRYICDSARRTRAYLQVMG